MARGIDLPNVSLVLNYDAPKHGTTYVHRVGRTARANRKGEAITFLKQGQVCVVRSSWTTLLYLIDDVLHFSLVQLQAFLKMRSEVDGRQLNRVRVNKEHMEQLQERYNGSLAKLQQVLQLEDNQEIRADDVVPDELLYASSELN